MRKSTSKCKRTPRGLPRRSSAAAPGRGPMGLRPLYCSWPRFSDTPPGRGLHLAPLYVARDLGWCEHHHISPGRFRFFHFLHRPGFFLCTLDYEPAKPVHKKHNTRRYEHPSSGVPGSIGVGLCAIHPSAWNKNSRKFAGKVPKDSPYRVCTSLCATLEFSNRHGPTEGGGNAMDMGNQPYALAREEGPAVWFLGTLVIMKATGEHTGGAFGLIDNLMPAGFASPYHMHRNEDESFYVVEGEMTFYVGEQRVKAGAGAFVYGPRGVPHGFEVNGTEQARILLQNYPAGFERFPVEVGEPAKELSIPPAEPPDMERLMAIAAKYEIEILGPLPGH